MAIGINHQVAGSTERAAGERRWRSNPARAAFVPNYELDLGAVAISEDSGPKIIDCYLQTRYLSLSFGSN